MSLDLLSSRSAATNTICTYGCCTILHPSIDIVGENAPVLLLTMFDDAAICGVHVPSFGLCDEFAGYLQQSLLVHI